jgi:hypothetical protein
MTKSRNIGRGGARPGSGPKKKPTAPPITEMPALTGNRVEDDKTLAVWVRAGLVHIAATGASEAARVAALKELGDRAEGKSKPGIAPKTDQLDLLDDGWGNLLKSGQPTAGGRSN